MNEIDLYPNLVFARYFYINIHKYEESQKDPLNFDRQFSLQEFSNDFEPAAINLLDTKESESDLKVCLKDYFKQVNEDHKEEYSNELKKIINHVDLNIVFDILKNSYATIAMFENNKQQGTDMLLNETFSCSTFNTFPIDNITALVRMTHINGKLFILDRIKNVDMEFALEFSAHIKEQYLSSNLSIESNINILKINAIPIMLAQMWIILESTEEEFNISEINTKNLAINEFLGTENIEHFEKFLKIIYLKQGIDEDGVLYFFSKFYDLVFSKIDINFSNVYEISLEDIFLKISNEGIIYTEIELKMFLNLMKAFYEHLSIYNGKYKKTLQEIKNIQNSIFIYIEKIRNCPKGFFMENKLLEIVGSGTFYKFLDIFSEFLEIIQYSNLTYSSTDENLTEASIRFLAEELNLVPTKNVKHPKQHHYPIIEFIYNFLIQKDIIKKHYNEFEISNRFDEFFNFRDEFKYVIFIEHLFNKDFLKTYMTSKNADYYISNYINIYTKLSTSNRSLNELFTNKEDAFFIDFLLFFNLIAFDNHNISLTDLGRKIMSYYFENRNLNNIINLKRQ